MSVWDEDSGEWVDESDLSQSISESIRGKHRFTKQETHRGASKGGLERSRKLSSERRREISKFAAQSRWKK